MEKQQAIATAALSKCVAGKDEKAACALVPNGCNHGFEAVVRITGRLTRGDAGEANQKSALLSWAVVADLIRRLGATRAQAERHLLDIAAEALALKEGTIAEKLIDANPDILAVMHTAEKHVVENLPMRPTNGAIKVVSEIEWQQSLVDSKRVRMVKAA